jgi:hypothetical protein
MILDGMVDTALIYNRIKNPKQNKSRKSRLKKYAYVLGQQKALSLFIKQI